MNTVFVYFTESSVKLSDSIFDHYIGKQTPLDQEKINAFKRWEDAQSSLLGKMLLRKALHDLGKKENLSQVQLTPFGRPYLNESLDFNISHSGDYVLCAVSENGLLGIDVEKLNPIQLTDYQYIFSAQEWAIIMTSSVPLLNFYKFWTIKEAVTKAHGSGLNLPLDQVEILDLTVSIGKKQWNYHSIEFNEDYVCHLATDIPCPEIQLIQIDMNHLDESIPTTLG